MSGLMSQPVVSAMAPVFLLVGAGYLAGARGWIRGQAVQDLSNLVFLLLIPALLFRTMSGVRLDQLDLRPIGAYFPAALLWLAVSVVWRGFSREGVVMALGGVFSNMVMIGITLVELAYGKPGLVTLLTLVSVHALILLTVASVVLEVAQAREQRRQGGAAPHLLASAWSAFKGALIHPIPLPILCGLAFAQTGWQMPAPMDRPLQLLGSAFGPLSLVLVGVSLSVTSMSGQWRTALTIALAKNLAMPLLVGLSAWAWGIKGLAWQVMVVAAALPTGANVYMFAQRYRAAQEVTTAAMGVSTVLALFTLGAVMLLVSWV
jgi:malonate transporter and related proteins